MRSYSPRWILRLFIVCILALNSSPLSASELNKIKVVTSHFPPHSYIENGQIKGVAVDRIKRAFKKLEISPEIAIYPWPRAYSIAEKTPNTLIFSMARNEKREDLFKWIGKTTGFNVHVFRKADRNDIEIKSFNDLGKYKFVGLLNDVKTNYLKSHGFNVNGIRSEELGISMLLRGRADLMASDWSSMEYRLNKFGITKDKLVSVFFMEELSKPLYAAFNRETNDRIVEKFREALRQTEDDGSSFEHKY
ncbi:MAG: transporter substrate-binding domain-containing protein [Rhodospirillales bacterium]|nr:transporter substrate-binding domain-containing protein [Rhodospirillales bacterium]